MVDMVGKAREIRVEIIKMLLEAGSGHTAGAMGAADLFAALYFGGIVRYKKENPYDENRDRVVLSCGHYAPALYASLALAGFFPVEDLKTLRKLGSSLQGHPVRQIRLVGSNYTQLPGVENTGGPLGQGVSIAVWMALAGKMDKKGWKVVCLESDAEQQEGQIWEAYETATKYNLGNLTFVIDRNDIQISGSIGTVMPIGSLRDKLTSFGLRVFEIDGNNTGEIFSAFEKGKMFPDQPKAVIMRTISGKGVSFMEGDYRWHGKTPTVDEAERALQELKIL